MRCSLFKSQHLYLCIAACWAILWSQQASAQIVRVKSGEIISVETLVEQVNRSDFLLLGELHDNPLHHHARGKFIMMLARPDATVVSEHFAATGKMALGGSTLDSLEAGGFDPKAWGWPLHAALFEAIRTAGLTVIGGNLPKGLSKELIKGGQAALPKNSDAIFRQVGLTDLSRNQLNQDLIDGHCGQLPDKYLAPMMLVQRATDISMAIALMEHKPALLVAGNGHVRKDYGVPQILATMMPASSVISVGFVEGPVAAAEQMPAFADKYDFVWFTDAAERTDPCDGFKLK